MNELVDAITAIMPYNCTSSYYVFNQHNFIEVIIIMFR